jgi:hypothetical protein
MMDLENLKALTAEIMAQGYDENTALDFAVIIGDTPVFDPAGNVLVMDGNTVLATLKPLKFFFGTQD